MMDTCGNEPEAYASTKRKSTTFDHSPIAKFPRLSDSSTSTTSGMSEHAASLDISTNQDVMEEDGFDIALDSNERQFDYEVFDGSYPKQRKAVEALVPQLRNRQHAIFIKVPDGSEAKLRNYLESVMDYRCEYDAGRLILKTPQSAVKSIMAGELFHAIKIYGGSTSCAAQDTLLSVSDLSERAPDVCFWSIKPTSQQLNNTISERCPLPNLWVEIFYNNPKDRNAALNKIRDVVLPTCSESCAIVAIGLTSKVTQRMLGRIGYNDPINSNSAHAEEVVEPPRVAPYLAYWQSNSSYDRARWFKISRNQHVDIAIPGKTVSFRLEFNVLIDAY